MTSEHKKYQCYYLNNKILRCSILCCFKTCQRFSVKLIRLIVNTIDSKPMIEKIFFVFLVFQDWIYSNVPPTQSLAKRTHGKVRNTFRATHIITKYWTYLLFPELATTWWQSTNNTEMLHKEMHTLKKNMLSDFLEKASSFCQSHKLP